MRKIALASLVALAVIFSSMPVRAEVVEEVVAEVETEAEAEVEAEAEAEKDETPEKTEDKSSEPTVKLPPLPKVDTDQLYAREKTTELESDGQLVTTLTYKTPTQAFSEQHQQIDELSTQVKELMDEVKNLKGELSSVGTRVQVVDGKTDDVVDDDQTLQIRLAASEAS